MLCYNDVCKRDMKSAEITDDLWEAAAADRRNWFRAVPTGGKRAEAKREQLWHDKRERQRARATSVPSLPTAYICRNCDRNCHSRIELYSHRRRRLLQYSELTFPAQSIVFRDRRRQQRCCFAEDGKEMYQNLKRMCRAIVLAH